MTCLETFLELQGQNIPRAEILEILIFQKGFSASEVAQVIRKKLK